MENENITFDEFVNSFKELSIDDKREEIVINLKEIIALSEKLCIDLGINHELLINREILDLKNDSLSEDDYLEAVFVFINSIKDSFGTFAEKYAQLLYDDSQT